MTARGRSSPVPGPNPSGPDRPRKEVEALVTCLRADAVPGGPERDALDAMVDLLLAAHARGVRAAPANEPPRAAPRATPRGATASDPPRTQVPGAGSPKPAPNLDSLDPKAPR